MTYYHVGDTLNFLQDGNFVSLNITTGKSFTFDTSGYLTQIFMTEEGRFVAKDKNDKLYANNLGWLKTVGENGKPLPYIKLTQEPIAM